MKSLFLNTGMNVSTCRVQCSLSHWEGYSYHKLPLKCILKRLKFVSFLKYSLWSWKLSTLTNRISSNFKIIPANVFSEKFHIKHNVSETLKHRSWNATFATMIFLIRCFEPSIFLGAWTFLLLKQNSQEGKFSFLGNSALWQVLKWCRFRQPTPIRVVKTRQWGQCNSQHIFWGCWQNGWDANTLG